ncbi:MAG TPA: hypothetical protein PLE45_12370 [Spirochaetota bacterium]|nr:hypothetical protein [Spirochaetota bacterium]HOL58058.1 hypothetical protein [Spirochaetota bacterium]HPP05558.1 hypothetical protein [Spirochaetota bacterium]
MKKEKIKVNIPEILSNTLKEASEINNMSISEYISYLIYKENYLNLSINSLHREKPFEKFYQRINEEFEEKDLWSKMFNL